jgi:hypothetical protein
MSALRSVAGPFEPSVSSARSAGVSRPNRYGMYRPPICDRSNGGNVVVTERNAPLADSAAPSCFAAALA